MIVMRSYLALLWLVASCTFTPGELIDSRPTDANAATDTAVVDVAATPPDAGTSDTPPMFVTLRQTQSDVKGGQSDACNGPGVGQSRDETYARTFPIATAFHLTTIVFLASNANDVAGLTVKVGMYAGATGTTTLDTAAIAWTDAAMIAVPSSANGQLVSVPIAMTLLAGDVLAVAIVSPGYSGAQFNVGSAAGSETLPSYFASAACGIAQPSKTDPRNGSDVGTFIIDAIGYAL